MNQSNNAKKSVNYEPELQLVEISHEKTAHELLMDAYKKLNEKLDVLCEKRKRSKKS